MTKDAFIRGYYFITDTSFKDVGFFEVIECALRSGVTIFQYRNKEGSLEIRRQEATKLRSLCKDKVLIIMIGLET